ncbi:MAG: hypothetical protein QOH05_1952 [Acetobacteraceae bacterium]|jgi:hypothetical protein|nr:hypothetical protein [Acetobacteraceae bacterium]
MALRQLAAYRIAIDPAHDPLPMFVEFLSEMLYRRFLASGRPSGSTTTASPLTVSPRVGKVATTARTALAIEKPAPPCRHREPIFISKLSSSRSEFVRVANARPTSNND